MEWRDSFLDLVLIPLSLLLPMAYHAWLWREVRLRPLRTAVGINAATRRLWAIGMMKDNAKNAVTVVQSVRNVIMGSTLMATTAILFCTGVAAVLSSTYTIKKPLSDTVFGAHGEYMMALKYVALMLLFLFAFLCHSLGICFLNQAQRRSQRGGYPCSSPPTAMIYMEPGLSPGYRREEEEEGKEGLEEEEEEASPGFVADQASFLINTSGCLFAASADADADSDSEAVSGLPLPHTRDYIGDVLERGFTLNLVGNRLFYAGVPLLLWIFGPLLAFLSSMVMIPILYSLDVVNLRGHSGCVVSGKSAEMNGSDCTHVV